MPPQVSYELANWNGELSNFQPQHIPSRPPSLPRRTKRPVIAVEQREKSIEQRSMPPSHARHTPPGSHPTKAQSTQTKRHPKPPCLDSSDLENNEKANMTVERMLLSEDFTSSDEVRGHRDSPHFSYQLTSQSNLSRCLRGQRAQASHCRHQYSSSQPLQISFKRN